MLQLGPVTFSRGVILALAFFIYLDSSNLVALVLLAALCHELGHYTAIRLLGGRVSGLSIALTGANMTLDRRHPLSYRGELIAILCGPAVNLLLATGSAHLAAQRQAFYVFAGLNLALGAFNLLPIYPLDGGRALHLLLLGFHPPASAWRMAWASSLCAVCLLLAIAALLFAHGAVSLSLLGMCLWLLLGLLRGRVQAERVAGRRHS